MIDVQLDRHFDVVAYDERGYGDNASRKFTNGDEAVSYARSLEPRFGATVRKVITMRPICIQIWPQP